MRIGAGVWLALDISMGAANTVSYDNASSAERGSPRWLVVAWGIFWRAVVFGVAYGAGLGLIYGVVGLAIAALFIPGDPLTNMLKGLATGVTFGAGFGLFFGAIWGLIIGLVVVPVMWTVTMLAIGLELSFRLNAWLMYVAGFASALWIQWAWRPLAYSGSDPFADISGWLFSDGAPGLIAAFAFAHIGYRIAKWVRQPEMVSESR